MHPTNNDPCITNHTRYQPPQRALTYRKSLWMSASVLAALSMADAPPALAQTGHRSTTLEEVVVTASRRAESMQDVAVSMTAINSDTLDRQGISEFQDIKKVAAGVHLEESQNSSTASIRIRGVGSSGNSSVDPSVGVLIDGVYQTSEGAAFTELMDVERVEVLRGPQGTLFGKNTTAGVIHIHTKDPVTDEFSTKIQAVAGNLDRKDLRGLINIPLIEDKLAVRLSGFTASRDGYTENTYIDEDTRNYKKHGGSVKFLWNATDNLEVKWKSEIMKKSGDLDEGLIEYGNDFVTSRLPVSGQPWSDLASALGKTLPPIGLGKAAQQHAEYTDDIEHHALTLNWMIPGHTLTSITAYDKLDSYLLKDRDGTALDLSTLISQPDREAKSEELILTSEWHEQMTYVIGAFYQQEKLYSPTDITTDADAIALGARAAPPTVSSTTWDNHTSALFSSLSYDLNDQWTVIGGVRYTEDTKDNLSELAVPGLPVINPVDAETTFSEWTYSLKTKYHFDEDRMMYLSFDHGFKSGGFNRQGTTCLLTNGAAGSCLTQDELMYDPETTDSIEIGLKSVWLDSRLRLNAAIFYQTYDDYQATKALFQENTVLIANAAEVTSKGVEFDLSAAINENWSMDMSMAWVKAEYESFDSAPCALTTQPGCSNGIQDLSGEQLDNAPELTTNLGVEYRTAAFGSMDLELFGRVNASYQSDTNLDAALAAETEQDAYTLYSARLGLESLNNGWTLTFWGENLSNEEYVVAGALSSGGLNMYQGLTRTYGMTLDWNF